MKDDDRFVGGAFGELRRSLNDDSLVVVALPSLAMCLSHAEMRKDGPLTEAEVLAAVDAAPAIAMLREDRDNLYDGRGYGDLDPDNVWQEWQEFRDSLNTDATK